ncbi:MAG: glycoside hydrolase family 172 protein [Planctomycetota bacterium]|jgi:hypothetical protein
MTDSLKQAQKPAGVSRQLTTFNLEKRSKTIDIKPGARITVGQVSGAGHISRLWLTFPGWFWPHWNRDAQIDPAILKSLIMRIYWDNAKTPAVESPVGDFFGAGHCEFNSFTSRFVGTSSGGFFCFWPMPYANGFRIEVENRHPSLGTDVFLNANYQELDAKPTEAGYFCTQFHTARRPGHEQALILETTGNGHYAGVMLHMQGEPINYLSFLEAPEYIYIDDDWKSPRIFGTGLEDYFNGGWYFRDGEFSGPMHGVPLKDPLRSMITMYRLHENDAIAFDRRIKFAFVNPWEPERLKPYWYSSVAYWYNHTPVPQQPQFPNHQQVMQMYRTRDTDHISIP